MRISLALIALLLSACSSPWGPVKAGLVGYEMARNTWYREDAAYKRELIRKACPADDKGKRDEACAREAIKPYLPTQAKVITVIEETGPVVKDVTRLIDAKDGAQIAIAMEMVAKAFARLAEAARVWKEH